MFNPKNFNEQHTLEIMNAVFDTVLVSAKIRGNNVYFTSDKGEEIVMSIETAEKQGIL